ncbi:MAG: hypothetical protein P8M25_04845, partial [Paracoccaceae bacterium]|nr:hypothetical protein [Paracoccaceae bacterium]
DSEETLFYESVDATLHDRLSCDPTRPSTQATDGSLLPNMLAPTPKARTWQRLPFFLYTVYHSRPLVRNPY